MVHGTLHLLGYDHLDDNDAADMEAREVRALKRLGIANPYEVTA
jgi:probable rRNA maturation factor